MANIKTRALDTSEYENIINTIRKGFTLHSGKKIRPNIRIATALTLQANLGLRIGDIVKLRITDFLYECGKYRLNIIEEKTRKSRTFTVPVEIYSYIQSYALENGIKPQNKLFDLSVRAVQKHLKQTCDYLGIKGVSTHSFRKYFGLSIYNQDHDIELVRELYQHATIAVTQHYLSVSSKQVEMALQNHIAIPT